ncbi:lysoplasmalogenase [Aeromicrobium ginsengisoli]|uniref:Lysoplasmalogenase n=1 Tax=Aeromicrobium ginsengisoli TaxID=363867 RepID=A0A5M4FA66_9ACTN|nr:lysoplasmalogenase [Aeromicrobium ginsengisoli]KAA1395241.1 lysoplasmalogenase [Aeromicrobium ginsengisoli]
MVAVKSPWLIAFGVVSVVHLALNAADATPWDSITKCFIAPLLAAWVLEQHGPRLLVAALGFCFLGDLFLELGDDLFVVGMAAFAAAHVCFIRFFVLRGALAQLRAKPWILVVYVAAAIGLVVWAWSGLEVGLRPIVPVYAALLLGTASTSLATDLRAGIGGACFLVSDGIIALGEADRIDKDATGTGLAIMGLYIVAILLLTTGILSREKRTIAAGAGFDPTIRTDCWPRLPQQM